MYVSTVLCEDSLTGRKVWACREIPSGEYGEGWLSGFVVIRPNWDSTDAELQLAESINTLRQAKLMRTALKDLGLTAAWGMRNNKKQRYKL